MDEISFAPTLGQNIGFVLVELPLSNFTIYTPYFSEIGFFHAQFV
jgi:hypothetical protein